MTSHPSTDTGLSQCDIILAVLTRRAGEWVPHPDLAQPSQSVAVHSRINDLRQRGHTIQHRNEWIRRKCHSFYRLIKP